MIQLKEIRRMPGDTLPMRGGTAIDRQVLVYEVIHADFPDTDDGSIGGTTIWSDVEVWTCLSAARPEDRFQAHIRLDDMRSKATCQEALEELARYLERVAAGIRDGLNKQVSIPLTSKVRG